MVEGAFPRDLLTKPAETRLAYFRGFTMAHPLLREADQALREAIREPAGRSLIFVYGPTGVGKTTLRLRLEKFLKESFLQALRQDPGRMATVSIEAAAPDSAQFSWKDYYRRALIAMEEPLLDRKMNYRVRGLFRDETGGLVFDSRTIGLEIRHALEGALAHRRPAAFFVDEAQHLAKMKSGRKLQDQLDSIKSLASLTRTVHVLVGTYELLPFRNLSAQLSRRSIDIHFRRYQATRSEDYAAFQNVAFTFQQHLPLDGEIDLLRHLEYLYERSIGCVGVLKEWLTHALALALGNGSRTIPMKILQQTAWSIEQAERMAKEAAEGEAELLGSKDARERLRQLLGLESSASMQLPATSSTRPPCSRVGQRQPVRDVIGAKEYNECRLNTNP